METAMQKMTRRAKKRGLTLIEICVTMGLVVFVAYLSLSALGPAADKGSTRGLAGAVKEELEATRQLAIRSGQPVALGIPTDGGTAACSLYRLQGWNTPYVKWSGGYEGDYPNLGFAAATWGGPGTGGPASVPPSAKYFNFGQVELLAWIPDDKEDDYVFCYLPDGSLITNGLGTVDGKYSVVVASSPTFAGAVPDGVTISSGTEPWVLLVSPGGGVEMIKGTPGTSLPAGAGNGAVSNPQPREEFDGESRIYLSEMKVRPNPSGLPGEGICVPGQVVTLEIYAHCPEGDGLFANWTQVPGTVNGLEGSFTYPNQTGSPLPNEADRMEFIPPNRIPTDPNLAPKWSTGEAPAPGTGIWKAQWTWTVPTDSVEGELYNVTANVQNAEADATIVTSPLPQIQMNPAPTGRMIVERRVSGLWQLWRMNPDGSGEQLISPEGVQEMMPSLDKYGTQMALIREGPGGLNDRRIVLRSVDGGSETIITNTAGTYTSVSLSPLGNWVAYRDEAAGELIVARTDGTGSIPPIPQAATSGHGYEVNKFRAGWSQDGNYVLYENGTTIHSRNLSNGTDTQLWGPYAPMSNGNIPKLYAPTSYSHNGREFVVLSNTTNKPFLLSFEVTSYETTHNSSFDATGSDRRVRDAGPNFGDWSSGTSQSYADVSHDGKLVYTESPGWGVGDSQSGEETESMKVYVLTGITADGVFFGPPTITAFNDVRRAIFIPPGD
jgi:type II secretory pathway pseudopilin PulG